jgi:hypothetical protein
MDTWIIWIVGCSIAFWLGQFVGKHQATISMLRALAKDPESFMRMADQIKKIEEAETESDLASIDVNLGTEMRIERVGEQLYAYAKDTGEFLAQASNLDKLLETVKNRFPDKKFFGTISQDDTAKELVK